ncbi:MAG TPA: DUF4249 domain-containing protein [Chryseosolibacter sp.]|nr:DUF4249 domain-containing protein [Chryseosolibacter sp.]
MKNILIVSLIAITFLSCEEPYQLDEELNDGQKMVIEALLTDREEMQFVKVSQTSPFYSSGNSPRIPNATVTVSDNLGNAFSYTHNPGGSDDSIGVYLPPAGFVGVIGRTYKLQVEYDDVVYEAEDQLLPVTPVDSLTIELDEEEQEDPEDAGRFYEVLIFAEEPQDEENFYLFKFYRNDSLSFANDSDIYYSDDKLLAEQIDGIPMPVYFGVSDKAKVEAYSLSRAGYVFYNDLWSLLNNDSGGMFGPIPATPRTNLSNKALGFFQVSAVSMADIIVE